MADRVPTYVLERRFKPGEIARESGVYTVLHHRHRSSHPALVMAGMVFPACRRCGHRVRFQVAVAAQEWDGGQQQRTPTLLLVDEQPDAAEPLRQALERDGYVVATASSCASALAMLGRHPYDAVLSELDLEAEHAGLELARAARSLRSPPAVILSTASASEGKLRVVLGSRIDYLVTKPIDLAELRSALNRLMLRRAATLGPAAEPPV